MANLSKSKYTLFWECPKYCWLCNKKPEVVDNDEASQRRMDIGNEVGDLAMGLFGDFVEVTTKKEDGKLGLSAMIKKTKEEMDKGTNVICEASFAIDGNFCSVDILKRNNDAWDIYEVKSATEIKEYYYADVGYQKYVLEKCGVKINDVYVVTLNSEYVKTKDVKEELDKLFKINKVTETANLFEKDAEKGTLVAKALLDMDVEPEQKLFANCKGCACWDYCTKDLPKPNVFNIYRLNFSEKLERFHRGLVTYEDVFNYSFLNDKQKRQITFFLKDMGTYVNKKNIEKFLNTLSYPLYFLDFETMQPAIPLFDGTHPYQQIPTQYSLHILEKEDGELEHKEFLGDSVNSPLRAIAERLCEDIPMNVCTLAYNKAFECTRIGELAELFPDLREHLLNIKENIKDLLDPFQNGDYYKKEMGGSFSIKSVLPALFPDDPSLNYHALDQVHNGTEAMNIYPQIALMSQEDQAKTRHNLLKYCELDTLAMVKVWEELVKAVKE